MLRNPIPRSLLRDRVEIRGQRQSVSGQEVVVSSRHTIAKGVRTLIVTSSAASLATIFGMTLAAGTYAYFGASPRIEPGDSLHTARGEVYTVQTVDRHPSPTRFNVQVAVLKLDLVGATP